MAREAARRHGDRTAFVSGDQALTFADLDRVSDEVAAGLAERGVSRGDVVVLVLPTALAYSCDTYFYRLGDSFYTLPPSRGQPEQAWATKFGFGRQTPRFGRSK